ncbi:MAG: tRNA (N6-threonylcarbamoyladenosine(37)-N6)-methyltransferase TrmO [Kiritimatiellae bacterium]|nr:tRNA (N6-threonylcarbamoyladenosine(37)-N6)-methyltransferase TrmO [Kiritimatiellia bacterium]
MNAEASVDIAPIGVVRKGSETESDLYVDERWIAGLRGLEPGSRIDVLYWMHRLGPTDRQRLEVHPRGDQSRPLQGVFSLRSPMRPNPIGVSRVDVLAVDGARLRVGGLDAEDGSPILDIKSAFREPKAKALVDIWGRMHDGIMRKLEAQFGHRMLYDLLYRPVRAAGREAARERLADAAAIGRRIMGIEALWDIRGRVVEETADRFVREVTVCPWSGLTPLTCRYFAWWMEGFVEGSNADFAYRLKKLIPGGARTCVWHIERAVCGGPVQN